MFIELMKNRTLFIFLSMGALCTLLLTQQASADDAEFDWAKNVVVLSPSCGEGNGIAVDGSGNVYVTGSFYGTATFGSTTLTSAGGWDIFITKLNAFGGFEWAKKAGGVYKDEGCGIAVDGSGNVYITGYFAGTATFGSNTLTATGSEYCDIFITKLNTSGGFVWAASAGGVEPDVGYGIAVDGSGKVYITGHFIGTATFGSTTLTSTTIDVFIAKLNSSGTFVWATPAGGVIDEDIGHGIAVDGSGNVYVTGLFYGTATFGSNTLTATGSWDIFIAKLNTSGGFVWAKQAGGTDWDGGRGIAVDVSGNVYVIGDFCGTATFGSNTLTAAGSWDIFIVKLNTSGNFVWAKQAGGTDWDEGYGIAVDASGNVYVTGFFRNTATFGSITFISTGHNDIFIAKLNTSGGFVWAKLAGREDSDIGNGIAVDGSGNVYVTGFFFSDIATFGSITLTNQSDGRQNIFISKLKPLNALPDIIVTNVSVLDGTGPDISYRMTVKNNGTGATDGSKIKTRIYLSTDNIITTADYLVNDWNFTEVFAAGASKTSWDMTSTVSGVPEGEYYLGVITDANNLIAESNENNNTGYDTDTKVIIVTEASLPDMIVSSVDVIDGTGPDISWRVTVMNNGAGATNGSKIKTRIYLSTDNTIAPSDYLLTDWNVIEVVAADASKTSWDMTYTVSGVPVGQYYLGVITDANNLITESDENNNTGYDTDTKVTIPEEVPVTPPVILDVPMAVIAPVIDGQMDAVWYSVCSVPMEKQNVTEATAPDDWLDCFASFKMMYDNDYYYIFVKAYDDILKTTSANSWENDSVDLFFDGDNSKNDKATGYDSNDRQLRYVYGQVTENTGIAPHSNCRFLNTENGYDLEIQISSQDMTFNLEPDHTFGFEIQINDNDTGGRDHMLKWWDQSNDTWLDASLFGTARTTDYVASSPMYILEAPGVPTIDGAADESVWEDIPWISDNTFVYKDNGGPFNPMPDLDHVNGWNDCRFNYKLMWREDMLYFFARVYDNVIDTSHPDYWMNDGMELQIDGNNDKSQTADWNDNQYFFTYSETPTSGCAFTSNSSGWTVEAEMDMVSDMGITPAVGHRIGLEVQEDDNDGGGRDLIARWWSDDNITWSNPSFRGTAELTGLTVNNVDGEDAVQSVQDFHLSQNYPNPFNPNTTIWYSVPGSCFVTLTVYDLLGREIETLVSESKTPGDYSVVWDGENHAAGIYLVRLTAGDFKETRKIVLQK